MLAPETLSVVVTTIPPSDRRPIGCSGRPFWRSCRGMGLYRSQGTRWIERPVGPSRARSSLSCWFQSNRRANPCSSGLSPQEEPRGQRRQPCADPSVASRRGRRTSGRHRLVGPNTTRSSCVSSGWFSAEAKFPISITHPRSRSKHLKKRKRHLPSCRLQPRRQIDIVADTFTLIDNTTQ